MADPRLQTREELRREDGGFFLKEIQQQANKQNNMLWSDFSLRRQDEDLRDSVQINLPSRRLTAPVGERKVSPSCRWHREDPNGRAGFKWNLNRPSTVNLCYRRPAVKSRPSY